MWIFLVIIAQGFCGSLRPDPCTLLNRTSVCLESGRCSAADGQTWIPCDQAYVIHSKRLRLIPISDPPVMSQMSRGVAAEAKRMGRGPTPVGNLGLPTNVTSHQYHYNLTTYMAFVENQVRSSYPLVIADYPIIRKLLLLAQRVADWMTAIPQFPVDQYRQLITSLPELANVLGYLHKTNEYFMSLSPHDPRRRALFANMVPLFHAWLMFHRILSLPPPFTTNEYLPFFTAATRYHPAYGASSVPDQSDWILHWEMTGPWNAPFLPPMMEIDTFTMISVWDYLGLDAHERINVTNAYKKFEDDATKLASISCKNLHEYASTVTIFMAHMKRQYPHETKQYCANTKDQWMNSATQFATCGTYGHRQVSTSLLLEYFRYCGVRQFDLETRVRKFLPAMQAGWFREREIVLSRKTSGIVDFLTTLGKIRPFSLEYTVRFDMSSDEIEQTLQDTLSLVSQIIPSFESDKLFAPGKGLREQVTLNGAGVFISLLMVHGNPHLKNFIASGRIVGFYLFSNTARKGFCKVVNCQVFELLFARSELPELIQLLSP